MLTDEKLQEICARYSCNPAYMEPCWIELYRAIAKEAVSAERDRADAYKKLSEHLDKLLTCYRIGRNPGKLIDKIGLVREIASALDKKV